jgi:hypothetical protein
LLSFRDALWLPQWGLLCGAIPQTPACSSDNYQMATDMRFVVCL